jgi:ankyrin repeat protein
MCALYDGHKDVAELLLEYGANINFQDNFGNTPLILGSRCNNIEILKILLNNMLNI